MIARGLIVPGAIAALAGSAHADPIGKIDGALSLEYEAGHVHTVDHREEDPGPDGLALAGVRIRVQIGRSWIGYRAGIDLRLGATVPFGFAYDVDLYFLGVGARLGTWSRFGVTAGVGASGATGTVDDAAQFPVEASLELALGDRLRVIARGRIAWIAAAPERRDGSRTITFADELEASLAFRLGHRYTDWGYPTGNGWFVGASYRESEGARMIGGMIGHSIDAGTK
jgi:hypothetical protein